MRRVALMPKARCLAGALAVLMAAAAAQAQMPARMIPADALRGRFTAGPLPTVTIDDKPMRLAPGARILNQENLTVTPNLVPANALVRYRLDQQGKIRTVWILTPEEARKR
jgi:hypothetical protein